MPLYRSPDGKIHDRDIAFAHLLPEGSERLSEEEEAEVLAELNSPTPEQLAQLYAGFLQQVRDLREKAINRLMGISGRASRAGDNATALACDAATESLLAITAGLPHDLTQAKNVVLARWFQTADQLEQAAPAAVSAFMGLEF